MGGGLILRLSGSMVNISVYQLSSSGVYIAGILSRSADIPANREASKRNPTIPSPLLGVALLN